LLAKEIPSVPAWCRYHHIQQDEVRDSTAQVRKPFLCILRLVNFVSFTAQSLADLFFSLNCPP
jgi:hypothetical protein